jgi:hypothetical protein
MHVLSGKGSCCSPERQTILPAERFLVAPGLYLRRYATSAVRKGIDSPAWLCPPTLARRLSAIINVPLARTLTCSVALSACKACACGTSAISSRRQSLGGSLDAHTCARLHRNAISWVNGRVGLEHCASARFPSLHHRRIVKGRDEGPGERGEGGGGWVGQGTQGAVPLLPLPHIAIPILLPVNPLPHEPTCKHLDTPPAT